MFLKTYSIEFDDDIVTFTDINGRPLEREDKFNLIFLINELNLYVVELKIHQIIDIKGNTSKDMHISYSREICPTNLENYWTRLRK